MGTTITLTIEAAQTKANLHELLMGCTRRVTPIEAIGQYAHLDSPPDRIQDVTAKSPCLLLRILQRLI
jgi:hypothetical protein